MQLHSLLLQGNNKSYCKETALLIGKSIDSMTRFKFLQVYYNHKINFFVLQFSLAIVPCLVICFGTPAENQTKKYTASKLYYKLHSCTISLTSRLHWHNYFKRFNKAEEYHD